MPVSIKLAFLGQSANYQTLIPTKNSHLKVALPCSECYQCTSIALPGCLAYGQPTLESASGKSYGRDMNLTSTTYSTSSTKNRSAESEHSGSASVSKSNDIVNDIHIPLVSDAQRSGRESVSKSRDGENGFNAQQLQQEGSGSENIEQLQEVKARLEAVSQENNELLQNQERVNAQWEGRVRRLERQLQAYQKGDKPTEVRGSLQG